MFTRRAAALIAFALGTLPICVSGFAADLCPTHGVLVYKSGGPVGGTTVFLMKPGRSEKVSRAVTGADGAFQFSDSPCGKYFVAPNVVSSSHMVPLYRTVDTRKAGEIRIIVPDDSRAFSYGPKSRDASGLAAPAEANTANANSNLPAVVIDGKWHWELEARIRRDAVERFAGSKAVADYDKLAPQAQVNKFIETFGNEINRMGGYSFHDPKKLAVEYRAATWWTTMLPLPPAVDYAMQLAISRRLNARPSMEELGEESLVAARGIVRATASPESAEKISAEFEAADPPEKTLMFARAIREQMNARIWPSAFVVLWAYVPGDTPRFISMLRPDAEADWGHSSASERGQIVLEALQNLADKLDAAASDETGNRWRSLSSEFRGLVPAAFSGPRSVRNVFGKNFAEYHADPTQESRYIAAAEMFYALWIVEAATYY
jgi:hypothetical protein